MSVFELDIKSEHKMSQGSRKNWWPKCQKLFCLKNVRIFPQKSIQYPIRDRKRFGSNNFKYSYSKSIACSVNSNNNQIICVPFTSHTQKNNTQHRLAFSHIELLLWISSPSSLQLYMHAKNLLIRSFIPLRLLLLIVENWKLNYEHSHINNKCHRQKLFFY